jgi:hypothetical protein
MNGESTNWLVVEGCLYSDWLCERCVEHFPNVPDDDLMTVCQECVKELRAGLT